MLGMAVLHALSDAVASVAGHKICPRSTRRRRRSAC
jgi:xanthine dehydrogenase large subunit